MRSPSHAFAICAVLFAFAAGAESLPRPAGLEPNVRFWERVYSEVDSQGGFIHDSEQLDVVYEVVRFQEGLSRRTREKQLKKAKSRIRDALKTLAKGKRTGLSAVQAEVLARWPEGVTDSTLRHASSNLRFQLGQADRFREGLVRSGAWLDHIQRPLRKHGVPVELAALPHVESSFNPDAYSRVGAAGLWQFTRSTGRMYLRIDSVIDERLDPFLASDAAARLLARNYEITETWPLAITAYNHGSAGMTRAARKLGTKDIATIVRKYKSRTFGFASRNFYASFLAAVAVDRNALEIFGNIRSDPRIEYTLIEMPHFYAASSLSAALGVDQTTLRAHNGALRPAVWQGNKYVPRGYELRVPTAALKESSELLLARVPERERLAKQHRDRFHKVRRGETLSIIARRYGVKQNELVALNNLRSRHRIRVGQVLTLPGSVNAPIAVARQPRPEDGVYSVRRGDTLSIIARRFDVSESQLVKANALRNRNLIAVGQRLQIPGGPVQVATAKPTASEPKKLAPKPAEKPVTSVVVASVKPVPLAKPETAAETVTPEPEPTELASADRGDLALPVLASEGPGAESPDPSDYAVHDGRVTVQAEETLGHYAEWLEIRASQLRSTNGMRYGDPLVIGRRVHLDFDLVTPEEFERRRLEYHRTLQSEFFSSFEVTGTEKHVLRKGESLWYLAERKFRVPIWLLRQYNPELNLASLPAGANMVIPVVEPRAG